MNNESTIFVELREGKTFAFAVLVDEALVKDFARLSGDENPLHTDDAYAAETSFGRRVAHGMLAGALFSRLVGMYLPGRYAVYLSQSLLFHKPIRIGADVVISGTITQKSEGTRTIVIATTLKSKISGDLLVSGEARVQLLR